METLPATPERIEEAIEGDAVLEKVELPATPTKQSRRLPLERLKPVYRSHQNTLHKKDENVEIPLSPPITPTSEPHESSIKVSRLELNADTSSTNGSETETPATPPETPTNKKIQFRLSRSKGRPAATSEAIEETTPSTLFELPVTPSDSLHSSLEGPESEVRKAATRVLCCSGCSSYFAGKAPFATFSAAFTEDIIRVGSKDRIHISLINHIIELPTLGSSKVDIPSRFFAYINPSLEYHEVSSDFFLSYKDKQDEQFKIRCWFTCLVHGKYHELYRHEHRKNVTVGYGLREPELSPLQRAKERLWFSEQKRIYYRN